MQGIIIVNKPKAWTSFDVVAKIRSLTGIVKVGHSGTLDPMATGVLPIFIGRSATKLIDQFIGGDKGYLAEMTLGVRTDTLDATGKILTPSSLRLDTLLHEMERGIRKLLKKYTGEIEQVPPMYSAKQIDGQRLYKLARKGIEVERKPVKITIHKLEVINFEGDKVIIDVVCSKGTYIRQLVSDIGDDLGCGAHLSKLERTYAQPFHISQAINMETIITLAKHGKLDTIIIKPEEILNGQKPSQTENS
ncbi:tRNA pseudouridine(55) synthase TruB [Candidatus Saganbacteria bacterium CG08_land_8_20_14_0_20_45_16]|uniref:tRNA pseudouridine synthase B n=1 Tax=Candidatus Saganbacteria bacterium CG08_land_8_20_14_0_20_45_16 TaxID=2014293 RepID=A0A2H0XUQ9_UNCSA|nr:MAG: tRNA pseudouridine(55) synthase TruB [Candidatus Saganbacteria bacterium CG08_land_8_20_14_0_20_45_16]